MLQDDGQVASRARSGLQPRPPNPPPATTTPALPRPTLAQKVVTQMEPDATAHSTKANFLMQRIQHLGVQQRLVSQELDDCLCALVHLQRSQGVLSQQPVARANTSATVSISNTCPVSV